MSNPLKFKNYEKVNLITVILSVTNLVNEMLIS